MSDENTGPVNLGEARESLARALADMNSYGGARYFTEDYGEDLIAEAEAAQSLVAEVQRLREYLREKNEIIRAYAGPTGMTPEDVAHALALLTAERDEARAEANRLSDLLGESKR